MAAAFALLASAAFAGLTPVGGRGLARRTTAAPAARSFIANLQTEIDLFDLTADRRIERRIADATYAFDLAGYNIVRSFRTGADEQRVFFLNGNTGAVATFEHSASGQAFVRPLSNSGAEAALRCSSAAITRIGGATKLITHDSFTGRIRAFTLDDNGVPDLASMISQPVAEMKDKNLFSLYEVQVSPSATALHIIGLDTWTGETATYQVAMPAPDTLDLVKIASATWTRGWTSIDHLRMGDKTYRLLYKAAGDPYKQEGESGDEARRLLIEMVAADGHTQTIEDIQLGSDGGDISSIRFIQAPALGAAPRHSILLYKRTTAEYAIYDFSPNSGLAAKLDAGVLRKGLTADILAFKADKHIDVEPYSADGSTYLVFVNSDNATPLGYEQAERMGRIIHEGISNSTVGYQFMLAQSGRIFFSRAYGKTKIDPSSSEEVDMTTRTQLDIGSVSKLITAMTVLKLVENPKKWKLSLDDKIVDRVAKGQVGAKSWANYTPIRDLFLHTTGISENVAIYNAKDLTVDCQKFFDTEPDLDLHCVSPPYTYGNNCQRSYNNSNIAAARKVIEFVTGAKNSKDIVNLTRELWSQSIDLGSMTCAVNSDAYYYGPCNGAANCINYAGKSWRWMRGVDDAAWSPSCSASGWYASTRELLEFLTAIRYDKTLKDSSLVKTFLSTSLIDSGADPTAFSWDPPWSAGGESLLNKAGYMPWDGVASRSYVTRLPHNGDAVLLVNTENASHLPSLLEGAYEAGVLDQRVLGHNGEYNAVIGQDLLSNVAVNTASTSATENRHVVVARDLHGNLELSAFLATRIFGEKRLDLIDKQSDSGYLPALSSEDLGVTDGSDFAVASISPLNQLLVTAWSLDGNNLARHTSALGPTAKEVDVARVAVSGPLTRIVTAIRNVNDDLQLDVWDINYLSANIPGTPPLSTITHRSSTIANAGDGVTIKNLGPAGDLSQPARFVTASLANVDNGDLANQLVVRVWEVAPNGKLEEKSSAVFKHVEAAHSPDALNRVAIDTAGDGASTFFNGGGFIASFFDQQGKVTVTSWSVDTAGKVSGKAYQQDEKDCINQALSSTTSIVVRQDGSQIAVKLIKWYVDWKGNITLVHRLKTDLAVRTMRLATTGSLFGAFVQSPADTLKVVNWTFLNQ